MAVGLNPGEFDGPNIIYDFSNIDHTELAAALGRQQSIRSVGTEFAIDSNTDGGNLQSDFDMENDDDDNDYENNVYQQTIESAAAENENDKLTKEEIIALSRAYAPGGKLLGLSSTKKLIATLHEVGEGLLQKYEINVWELHRADRGLLNGKNNMGGINNNMKQRKNFGAATPKLEVAVHCPSLTEIGRATDGHGGKVEASTSKIIFVNSIEFLDSSQPRYLASTLSYLKNFVLVLKLQ